MWTLTGLLCHRTGHVVELLWMPQWTFGFHKMREIFWPTEELSASQQNCVITQREMFVGRTVALMRPGVWISVCCQGLNINQPQALHNSSLLTHKCFPTANCVAASQSAPICSVWYPLLSIWSYRFALCEVPDRKFQFVGVHRLSVVALTAVRQCRQLRVTARAA